MPLIKPSGASKEIASVHVDIGADTEKFEKASANVKSGIGALSKNLVALGSAFSVVTTLGMAAKAAFDFSAEGAKLERLASAGDEIARQYGGNMDLIIQKIKEASLGTVSEMDIISSANRAMMLGLGADAEQLANLMEIAAFRGRAMGVDTTKAFSDIVTGVGRGSPLILDNLGIVVNAKETYDQYAASIGKSADELTKAEKTQALLNRVLEEGNEMLADAGGLYLDNAGKIEKMNSSAKNFSDNRKRENADLAGSFALAASAAIDGYDQMFKFFDAQGAIRERAIELRNRLDPGGEWQDFYETARIEFAAQNAAITANEQAIQDYAASAEEAAEALELLSEQNQILIDGAIDITNAQKSHEEQQQKILDKIAETREEGEKLYPWEHEKILENQEALYELGQQYLENQEKYKEASEERLAMMAVEAIALSDGIAGFSEAEYERARVILETQDIATAAAFEEQQAMTMLADAVAQGIVPVEQWGAILEQVMSDGVLSVAEVQAAIDAVPKQNTITFDIITNGAPPNLDVSGSPAPRGTYRSSDGRASGGQVWAGQSYLVGEQGMEIFTPNQNGMITPNSRTGMGGGTDPRIITLLEQIANKQELTTDQLARTIRESTLQVIK